jgi:hypothetical protein
MTLPVALACAKTMITTIGDGPELIADLDARTANLQLMFSALLSIALIAARFF